MLRTTNSLSISEMFNLETTKRVSTNLFYLGKQFVLDSLYKSPTNHQDVEKTGSPSASKSAEYILYHWLEALFVWFQMIILWHEPMTSVCAFTGLFASFLLITSLAPRFYATILLGILVYNLTKVWFRYIWPEIRVAPEIERAEEELRNGVDRWTHLHPQLMTLDELCQVTINLIKASEIYLHKLIALRREKPAKFCIAVCSTLSCTAFVGNRISDLKLLFLLVSILLAAPGIYIHILPKTTKDHLMSLFQSIKLSGEQQHSSPANESIVPSSSSSSSPLPTLPESSSPSTEPKPINSSLLSSSSSNDESASLIDFEEDQQDGFVIL